jgi:tripartite ATP-independent transporter DctM subunit
MTVLVFLGSLLGAMALGMPIAFALLACGVALMIHLGLFETQILAQNLMNGADNFTLMAIPFFILAGEFMNAGGLSRRIVDFCSALVGHFRGGLGYVAVLAAVLMASLSGSAVADAAALSATLIPMMRKAGYDIPRSAGLIAAGGIIAPVIPPSIGFIVFGVAAGVSVTRLFIAGIFPGILLGVSLAATWWWLARRDGVPAVPRASWAERLTAFRRAGWALTMPVAIVGGLKTGVFTPTEAGVVAAVIAFSIGTLVYRELRLREIYGLLLSAAKTSAVVMFLIAAALVSAWLITIANIPAELGRLLEPLIGYPKLLMAAMMAIVAIAGTALDFVPTVLILTPILMPIVRLAGIDPVYFGVLFIINNAIGLITPPVGVVLNVVSGVGRVTMDEAIRGSWPFVVALFVVLALLVVFPDLVLVPARLLS